MTTLPIIPERSALVALDAVEAIESQVRDHLPSVTNVEQLLEWRARAAALATYLHSKQLNGPMLGAQRLVEARIGQLLGQAQNGGDRKTDQFPRAVTEISPPDRARFRILARGLERGLPQECWRHSRREVISEIQTRFPQKPHVPTVVTASGSVKKPRAERIQEIRKRSDEGMRAAQIAQVLHINEETVRRMAKEENIKLPDFTIGKRPRLDARRILFETVNGVEAYVSGLRLLDGLQLPDLETPERIELMQTLARAINGLRKLKTTLEERYARPDATAPQIRGSGPG